MSQQTAPFLEGKYGWNFGESGWNTGMDENLLKFSFLFDRNVDSIAASLPPAVNGQAHYLTTDNRLYFAVGTTYFSTPVPKWFTVIVRSTGQTHQFDGVSLVQTDTPVQLDSRIDAVELTVSTLGTAAFQSVEFFATQAELDVAAATAASYTDSLRQDLAAPTGASLLGYQLPLTGSVAKTQADINRKSVYFDDFGAVGDGVTDDTVAIQAALNSGHRQVKAAAGKTYNITSVTVSTNNTEIILESGSMITPQIATARAIIISGEGCSIVGSGTIKGVPTFDGANVRPTYALVWVEGNGFTAHGITIDTIPKEGIMFEESTGARVENCRFIGRYPYASYDENSTTNHCGIMSNIPPSSVNTEPTLLIVGNYFESCIQGVLSANYGDSANNTGNNITGNTFKHCWDHGIYMSRGQGHTIVGNSFLSCRRPIVSDGIGAVVVGNTLYSTLTGVLNAEQLMSVRESSNSIIANNTLYGVDAGIFVDCIETTTMNNNIITGNNIFSTGTSSASAMIRLGVGATQCEQNIIRGNTMQSASLLPADYALQVTMLSGFGRGNQVSDNTIIRTTPGNGISINRNGYAVIKNNRVDISGSSASALSINTLFVDNSTFPIVDSNTFYYTSGGTNVTVTGLNVTSNCANPKVKNNSLFFTGTFAAYIPMNLPAIVDAKRNLLEPNASMVGKFTWPTATASFVVANSNVRATSKVMISPLNSGAATIMKDSGFYILPTLGGFTIFTGTGATTASASDWDYEII